MQCNDEYKFYYFILENVGYWEKTKWKNEWIYFFYIYTWECPSEWRRRNKTRKSTTKTTVRTHFYNKHSPTLLRLYNTQRVRERERKCTVFLKSLYVCGASEKNQYHHHDLSLNDVVVVIVNDVVCERIFSHIKIIKSKFCKVNWILRTKLSHIAV